MALYRFAPEGRQRAAIRLETTDDPDRWARAARASGQPVTPFHHFRWLQVAAGMTGHRFVPLVVRRAGSDIGTATWLTRARGPLLTANGVPFPYTGPLVPDEHLDATLLALSRRALRHGTVLQQHQLPPGVAARSRFATEFWQTYLLDTSRGEDALWAGMSNNHRNRIRQNERQGVRVEESAEASRTLARVTEAVFERRGLDSGYNDRYPPSVADLEQHGLEVHWPVITQGDLHLGSLVTLKYRDQALLWAGGVLPEHQTGNLSLYWEAIQWSARNGVRTLDMVGIPNPGIGAFKRRFGGTLASYAVIVLGAPGVTRLREVRRRPAEAGGKEATSGRSSVDR